MESRLRESLEHIFEQSRGEIEIDELRLERFRSSLDAPGKIPPALFGRYFALVRAIQTGDLRPANQAFGYLLEEARTFDLTEILIRPLNRANFSEVEERELREQYISESLSDEQVKHLSEDEAEQVSTRLNNALRLLETAAPRTFQEFCLTIAEIVPVRGAMSADGLVFDGSSSLERWGAILINTELSKTQIKLCEALAHESAHNTLFGTSPIHFHVTNSPEERYSSPLRLDPRPVEGIYHATFVLARMCFAMREMAECEKLPDEMRREARQRAESSQRLFWDGYAVLERHARYTPEGLTIIQAARDYVESLPNLSALS